MARMLSALVLLALTVGCMSREPTEGAQSDTPSAERSPEASSPPLGVLRPHTWVFGDDGAVALSTEWATPRQSRGHINTRGPVRWLGPPPSPVCGSSEFVAHRSDTGFWCGSGTSLQLGSDVVPVPQGILPRGVGSDRPVSLEVAGVVGEAIALVSASSTWGVDPSGRVRWRIEGSSGQWAPVPGSDLIVAARPDPDREGTDRKRPWRIELRSIDAPQPPVATHPCAWSNPLVVDSEGDRVLARGLSDDVVFSIEHEPADLRELRRLPSLGKRGGFRFGWCAAADCLVSSVERADGVEVCLEQPDGRVIACSGHVVGLIDAAAQAPDGTVHYAGVVEGELQTWEWRPTGLPAGRGRR